MINITSKGIVQKIHNGKSDLKGWHANYDGKQAVLDILNFKIIKSKKIDNSLIKLSKTYINKIKPIIPIGASELMEKYKIPEGKQLGLKLKLIEELWIKNNFKISDHQVEKIVKD